MLAAWFTEDIYLLTTTEVTQSLGDTQTDIAHSLTSSLQRHLLHLAVTSPGEVTDIGPLLTIHADRDATLEDGTVTGIQTRQVLQLVEDVHATHIDGQVEGHCRLVPVGMPGAGFVKIKEMSLTLSTLGSCGTLGTHTMDGKAQRISRCAGTDSGPATLAVLVHGAHLHRVVCLRLQVVDGVGQLTNGAVHLTLELHLVIVGIHHSRPLGRERVSRIGGDGSLGRLQCSGLVQVGVSHVLHHLLHLDGHGMLREVNLLCKYHVELLHEGQFGTLLLHVLAEDAGITSLSKDYCHLLTIHLGRHLTVSTQNGHHQANLLLGDTTLVIALHGVDSYGELVFSIQFAFDERSGVGTVQVGLRLSVIIIEIEGSLLTRDDQQFQEVTPCLSWCIVRLGDGDDSTQTGKGRHLPQRGSEIIEDTSTLVHLAVIDIHPKSLGQVDAITYVIVGCGEVLSVVLVSRCTSLLVDRSHEQRWTVHELVLCTGTQRVVVLIIQEHGSYHRHTRHCLMGNAIGIRHQYGLQFQVVAIDTGGWFTQGLRVLGISSPPIHIELHGGVGLPLVVTYVDRYMLTTKDSIHITAHVGLTRQSATNVGRDMETDVFPLTTCLVTGPDTGIALRTCPAIKGDDEGTSLITVVRHHLSHICHAVQSKRITGTNPGHIGLQYAHTRIANLSYNITLQKGLDTLFGVQVTLGPKTYLYALLTGIFAKLLKILHVALQGLCLTITSTITIIGKEPAQRHVIVQITVYCGTGRELIVLLLSIQTFLYTSVVLLTLVVGLAILVCHKTIAILSNCPIISVISI